MIAHRKCRWCGEPYGPRRADQAYCSTPCNKLAGNQEMLRARALYRALYHWRLNRKTAAEALLFICRSIRAWIDEDKQVGRPAPPRHDFGQDRGALRS